MSYKNSRQSVNRESKHQDSNDENKWNALGRNSYLRAEKAKKKAEEKEASLRGEIIEREKTGGRYAVPEIDKIAAKAWFNELKRITGAQTAAETADRCGQSSRGKNFTKYARGEVTPSHITLNDIDDYLVKILRKHKIRQVFDKGPEGIPLWDALSGNYETLWDIIDNACPEIPKLRYAKTAHATRVNAFAKSLLPNDHPDFLDTFIASQQAQSNLFDVLYVRQKSVDTTGRALETDVLVREQVIRDEIRQLEVLKYIHQYYLPMSLASLNPTYDEQDKLIYQESHQAVPRIWEEIARRHDFIWKVLEPLLQRKPHHATKRAMILNTMKEKFGHQQQMNIGFPQLAATIALWRISMLAADSVDTMDYIIEGLMEHAIPDMLKPYGVDQDVIRMIKGLQKVYRRWARP